MECSSKTTGVGSYSLLQGVFLTQGWNPHLMHWQVHSLPWSRRGGSDNTLINLYIPAAVLGWFFPVSVSFSGRRWRSRVLQLVTP